MDIVGSSGDNTIGGLVGSNDKGLIENSYAIGKIIGGDGLGGLVGFNNNGTITNSYWDTQTSGIATGSYGTGKTTAEMKQQGTYQDWDFSTVWEWVENDYPRLRKNSN